MRKCRRSLVWKLSMFMAIIIAVLITAVSVLYMQTFIVSTEGDARDMAEQARSKAERNIYTNLKDAEAFLNDLFYRQELSYFMNEKNNLSESEKGYYISAIQSALINGRYLYNNMFGNVCLYSSNKQFGEKSIFRYLDSLKEKPYYEEIMEDEEGLVFGRVRSMDKSHTVSIADRFGMGESSNKILPIYKKVYDLNTKEVIGIVEIDLEVARISNSTTLETVKGEKGVLILDHLEESIVNTLQGSKGLNTAVKKALEQKIEIQKLSYQGNQYMISYQALEDVHLAIASVISLDDAQTYLRGRFRQVFIVCLLCFLCIFAIIYYFVHSMLRRLLILDSMMAKVGEGGFGVVIADDKVEDEVTRITHSFNVMSRRLNQVMEERVQYEQSLKEAELRALQAQINPHFLYNTLENMRMQCETDEYYILSDRLWALGELFRYSISWGTDQVCFEVEWKNLESYISIMEMRYGESLDFVLEKDESLHKVVVPKLIIQPLVENCFNHGFKNKLPPWGIIILAKDMGDELMLTIEDNGNGIPLDRLCAIRKCLEENRPFRDEEQQRNSIGITNVRQRIGLICKGGGDLRIESKEGEGTKVTLVIKK